jgi:peroxiredoxin
MKKYAVIICLLATIPFLTSAAKVKVFDQYGTLVEVGSKAPEFTVKTLDGETFSLKEKKGKVVLVTFFATWCPPCLKKLPHLQSDVKETIKHKDFEMIVIGREHSADELTKFQKKNNLELPFAPDLDKKVFSLYAQTAIPRSFVIGKDGTIKKSSLGFDPVDFKKTISLIHKELDTK